MPSDTLPSKSCILIVESDLPVRRALADYLRDCGYRVIETINTDEARQVVEAGENRVDILLADAASPGATDGFGLAKWIRESGFAIRVILAGSVPRAAEKAGDLCEEGPLQAKPYDHRLLGDRIKRELAHRDRVARFSEET